MINQRVLDLMKLKSTHYSEIYKTLEEVNKLVKGEDCNESFVFDEDLGLKMVDINNEIDKLLKSNKELKMYYNHVYLCIKAENFELAAKISKEIEKIESNENKNRICK